MPCDPQDPGVPSRRYQDYVIQGGRLVGDFEGMYRNASEVPWHQDKTASALFSDFDLTIVRHFCDTAQWRRVLDVGCGLGYLTARLKAELPDAELDGIDVSETAILRAQQLHTGIGFRVADLRRPDFQPVHSYDLLFVKDLLWYILPELEQVIANLRRLLRPAGWFYMSQAVPGVPDFYGNDVFASPDAILDYFGKVFQAHYASSTHERTADRVVGVYEIDNYARFLGRMPPPTK